MRWQFKNTMPSFLALDTNSRKIAQLLNENGLVPTNCGVFVTISPTILQNDTIGQVGDTTYQIQSLELVQLCEAYLLAFLAANLQRFDYQLCQFFTMLQTMQILLKEDVDTEQEAVKIVSQNVGFDPELVCALLSAAFVL